MHEHVKKPKGNIWIYIYIWTCDRTYGTYENSRKRNKTMWEIKTHMGNMWQHKKTIGNIYEILSNQRNIQGHIRKLVGNIWNYKGPIERIWAYMII